MNTALNKADALQKGCINDRPAETERMHKRVYEKYILPRVIHFVCGLKPMMKQRQKTVPHASGRVLEIGIGSGLNLPFYNPDKVNHLWGLDPSAEMWALSKKARKNVGFEVEYIESGAENIPLDDNSADTVLITYALCTIPDAPTALGEIRRVLKPGGCVVFCEHGAAPDAFVNRLQNWLNPVWGKIGGGCHLNREIPKMIEGSGFKIQDMEASYIMGLKFASFNYRGIATSR